MTPDEFRRHGREVIDWIADYMEQVEQLPVLSQVKPGEIRGRLPDRPPQQGEPFAAILRDLNEIIMPGITHWQSPNFFAYFPSNNSGPSILGDLLASGLGVQGMLWATSPACTELETHVLDWLVDGLGLPERFLSTCAGGGVIQDSASSSVLCAILAARERAVSREQGEGIGERGTGGALVAYASNQTHSSIEKGLRIAGLGSNALRRIEVDSQWGMRPDRLAEAMAADIAGGRRPFFVCATVGTTSSLGFDPLRDIGQICRQHDVWLHVDAALAGTAAICPEFRAMHDGLELADSYCFNPHKWMFTNFDCSCFFVADRVPLIRALGIMPEYLKNQATQSGAVIDYRDWQIPLGRRFRALKLWFVLRWFGIAGIQQRVRQHVALAQEFAGWIQSDPRFELAAPAVLNLVCFRHCGGDEVNQQILDQVNASGKLFISHTRLQDRLTLRFCIGQTNTERRHVEQAWKQIREAAENY
ncbi:MAG: pyridoxal-dependent decarboxylase [Planctomycetota bacterium]